MKRTPSTGRRRRQALPSPPHFDRSRADRRTLLFVVAGAALVALAWLVLAPGGLLTYWRLHHEVREMEAEQQRLRQRNAALRAEIEAIEHDDELLEQVARHRYHLLRPNEEVFVFPEKTQKPSR